MRQQATGNRQNGTMRGWFWLLICAAASFCFILGSTAAAPVADPFADEWISYNPGPDWSGTQFSDPTLAIGAPVGLYLAEPDNSSLVTLGNGGNLTVKFSSPVVDDPRNPYGLDFIVFGNAQVNETMFGFIRWQELAFVEISQDGLNWYLIKPSILPADLRVCHGTPPNPDPRNYEVGKSYTAVSGYAEYTPTMGLPQNLKFSPFPGVIRSDEELYTVPDRTSRIRTLGYGNPVKFDFVSGGGDGFDIADAVVEVTGSPGVPLMVDGHTVPAGISSFSYVKITDAHPDDTWPQLFEVAADIDAVARTRPAQSIGEVKAATAGDYGLITEAIVTAVFPNEFFIEAPDRSAAMRVAWNSEFLVNDERAVAIGDRITVTGHLSRPSGRFCFADPMLAFTATGLPLPQPLAVPVQSLSSNMLYGMRVRVWGRVTDAGDGNAFVISDGDESIRVVSEQYKEPIASNTRVLVTGICDREEGTGATILRVIDPEVDIRSYP